MNLRVVVALLAAVIVTSKLSSLHNALIILAGGLCGHHEPGDEPAGRDVPVGSSNRHSFVKSVSARYIKR
jgi:hypothetical protein